MSGAVVTVTVMMMVMVMVTVTEDLVQQGGLVFLCCRDEGDCSVVLCWFVSRWSCGRLVGRLVGRSVGWSRGELKHFILHPSLLATPPCLPRRLNKPFTAIFRAMRCRRNAAWRTGAAPDLW